MTGTLTSPGIGTLDPSDPILRYVDLSTVHVGQAQKLELPAWARAVVPGPAGSPLLTPGARRPPSRGPRVRAAPLGPSAPGRVPGPARQPGGRADGRLGDAADAVSPGSPVTLPVPEAARGVRVERPDGSVDELVAPTQGAASVTFARTDLLGVYSVTPLADQDASAAPSGGSSPGSSAATTPGAAGE